ncbi:hypothetical protein [Brevibacillus porteri]|uniref:hypothetical protein n=1 Tax=Brevibacillus porteri TaxID=2126350 RepID=UPI002E1CE35E|nr:hypothetical protein [Brevibacillus porteri]MED2896570.1 hypothetical protein [Brevibacillus porteri]
MRLSRSDNGTGQSLFYGKEGRPNEQSTSVRQNASGTMVLEGTLLIPNASGKLNGKSIAKKPKRGMGSLISGITITD